MSGIVRTVLDGATPPAVKPRLLIDLPEFKKISSADINPGAITTGKISGTDTPAQPTGINASTGILTDGSAYILVQWNAVAGAKAYEIELKIHTSVPWTYVRTSDVASLAFRIEGLLPNVSYDYSVQAINALNNSSGFPNPLSITTSRDTTAPATPAGVAASAGVRSVIVTFTANTEVDLDHYVIEIYSDSGLTTLVKTFTGLATVWAYNNGTASTQYWARVKAVDTSGNSSAWSSTVTATTGQIANSDIQAATITADRMVAATITAASGILADAVITTAKIAALAVTDAKINDLAVGKLTAGTLSAAVILSGSIKTGTSGARVEIDSTGIRLYDSGGNVVVNLDASAGAGTFKGTLTAANFYNPATTGYRSLEGPLTFNRLGINSLEKYWIRTGDSDTSPTAQMVVSMPTGTGSSLDENVFSVLQYGHDGSNVTQTSEAAAMYLYGGIYGNNGWVPWNGASPAVGGPFMKFLFQHHTTTPGTTVAASALMGMDTPGTGVQIQGVTEMPNLKTAVDFLQGSIGQVTYPGSNVLSTALNVTWGTAFTGTPRGVACGRGGGTETLKTLFILTAISTTGCTIQGRDVDAAQPVATTAAAFTILAGAQ